MRRFVTLIISILLSTVVSPINANETIIYASINGTPGHVDRAIEYNIENFQAFYRNDSDGRELSIYDNVSGFKIVGNEVTDRNLIVSEDPLVEILPELGFYYGRVVTCDGLMGQCLIIDDMLKIYLPNTDFMSTQQYWDWEGCQFRSGVLIEGDIIMGHEIPPGVTIDVYCPEHEGYQHAYLLYSKEYGIMRISMYTIGEYSDWTEARRDLFLVNEKGFLAQN